jgi:hypothetical protein
MGGWDGMGWDGVGMGPTNPVGSNLVGVSFSLSLVVWVPQLVCTLGRLVYVCLLLPIIMTTFVFS